MESPNFSKSLNIRGASVTDAMLAALLCCEIRHEDVSRMQGGRHVTVAIACFIFCMLLELCFVVARFAGAANLSSGTALVFHSWSSDQSGLAVVDSVTVPSVYRTSVYPLLKCIDYLMYVT